MRLGSEFARAGSDLREETHEQIEIGASVKLRRILAQNRQSLLDGRAGDLRGLLKWPRYAWRPKSKFVTERISAEAA
jgi:hypothetical protein